MNLLKKYFYFASIIVLVFSLNIASFPVQTFAAGTLTNLNVYTYYTLTYTAGANGTISGSATQTVTKGLNGSTVTAVPNSGYTFLNWSDGVTTASRTDTNVQASLNVTAHFVSQISNQNIINSNIITPTTYTLTYTAGANGTISGSATQTVVSGSSGTSVKAIANSGYHFVSWSDGVTSALRTDTNVTSHKNVTAQFAINVSNVPTLYTLTYDAQTNRGYIQGVASQSVVSGSHGSTVKAIPNAGYHFVKWSDNITTASRTDLSVTENITVTALFATNSNNGGGGGGGGSTNTSPQSSVVSILGSGKCPANLTITNKLKEGARDGKYLAYNQGVVNQVYILQKQINRILATSYQDPAGPVDGIFGPKTKLGVMRLQLALKDILGLDLGPTGADGIVGYYTKAAINNSCGGM